MGFKAFVITAAVFWGGCSGYSMVTGVHGDGFVALAAFLFLITVIGAWLTFYCCIYVQFKKFYHLALMLETEAEI